MRGHVAKHLLKRTKGLMNRDPLYNRFKGGGDGGVGGGVVQDGGRTRRVYGVMNSGNIKKRDREKWWAIDKRGLESE